MQSLQAYCNFILRYFNVAGADKKLRNGQLGNSSNLFSNLSSYNCQNKCLKFFIKNYLTKDGTAVRILYIGDLSDIHVKSLSFPKRNLVKGVNTKLWVWRGYSVYDIVSIVKKSEVDFVFKQKRPGDLPFIVANLINYKKTELKLI